MIRLPNGLTMSQVGPSSGTRPERALRMLLVRHGLRYLVVWDHEVGPSIVNLILKF